MGVWLNSLLSIFIISVMSLVGISLTIFKARNLRNTLLILVGFATGAMFGDVFMHLIPELVSESGFTLQAAFVVLAGIIMFFVLEKFVHWRHCHIEGSKEHKVHTLATMNLVGDSLHNFVDGMVVAGSYIAGWQVGFATTLAVILHEIPQEIGDFGVLLHSGLSKARALAYNFLTALTAFAGALIVLLMNTSTDNLNIIIPFTIGGFIYIAGSDLMPELHKEKYSFKTSAIQLASILTGIMIMYFLKFFA